MNICARIAEAGSAICDSEARLTLPLRAEHSLDKAPLCLKFFSRACLASPRKCLIFQHRVSAALPPTSDTAQSVNVGES